MKSSAKKSRIWTVCYFINSLSDDDGPYTATWFAYGKTADDAKRNFLLGQENPDDITIDRVFPGFSA